MQYGSQTRRTSYSCILYDVYTVKMTVTGYYEHHLTNKRIEQQRHSLLLSARIS